MPQFRAKARAVELLGKGQISDLPTAISELWKNGYDAYGNKLESSLYLTGYEDLKYPLFLLSDDGKGMTRDDILNKWIVLGTDSKTRNEPDKKGEETLWKEPRIKMGEKGIGRLSVAYLGSQMLMVTKKIGYPTQALFFDWRVLDNYNLFLEDINVPIKTIESAKSFPKLFESLKTEFLQNFPIYQKKEMDPWHEQIKIKNDIVKETAALELPSFFSAEILNDLIGSSKDIHGTKFLIFNPDPQLLLLKSSVADKKNQEDVDEGTLNYIRAGLTGLFNVFKEKKPEYSTNFWIIDKNGKYDFIDKREFFDSNDFKICDHVIEGKFNDQGVFSGALRIYEKTIKHTFKPHRLPNKSSYGPLNIRLGIVEGDIETPILKGEQRKHFKNKLDDFGGLYIYRDGFRVLPYGRTEYDFLGFEERRSKGAGYYYFSHRRMFGYMEITRGSNANLRDKAGREGFINNVAYREFKKDLQDFFIDLSRTYFGDKAKSDIKSEQQKLLEELIQTEKEEKEIEKRERKNFANQLREYPKQLQQLEKNFQGLNNTLEKKLRQSNIIYNELEEVLQEIENLKIQAENLRLKKPARFKPTEVQRKNLNDYNKSLAKFKSSVLSEGNSLVDKARDLLKEKELLNEFGNRHKQYFNTLVTTFDEYKDKLGEVFGKLKEELDQEEANFTTDYEDKYKDIIPQKINKSEIKNSLKLLERVFTDVREKAIDRIDPFIKHLEKINFSVNEDNLIGYYKIKYEEMEEEWEKTRELAQLGIAVEIIDHQFNVLYSQLSDTITSFEQFVKTDIKAKRNYEMLKNSFEHLENNYKLLTPLYRTTGRIRKEISGTELFNYINQFFSEQWKDKKIDFSISPAGKKYVAFSYESILKPVLVNIINNAIYWLQSVDDRKIVIDADDNKLLIMNSGEPIDDYLLDDIFKLFYSKRPKGRGIGLYLAKTSLNGIGYDIVASNSRKYNKLKGACFIISPIPKK